VSVLLFTRTWVLLSFWWVFLTLQKNLGFPRLLVGLSYSSREPGFSKVFGGSVLLLTRTWVLLGFCGSVLLFTRTCVLLCFWWVCLTLHENLGSPRFLRVCLTLHENLGSLRFFMGLSYSSLVPVFSKDFGGSVLLFTSTWVLLGFWWVCLTAHENLCSPRFFWVCLTLHENLVSPRFLVGLSYSSREHGFS